MTELMVEYFNVLSTLGVSLKWITFVYQSGISTWLFIFLIPNIYIYTPFVCYHEE